MNAIFTQDKRLGKLTTVLGKDTLVLLRFDGTDHINDLFEYRVEALSTAPNIDFDGLIGTHASVEIESQNDGTRVYDGLVTEAKWAGVGENGNKYALTLRPWLWVASQRRNQRIFHNKTVVQIIEELLAPYSGLGDPALKVNLSATYPDLEYTVQYRESDLAFATRLMERFGISYHFTHQIGSHTLVLTDTIEAHDPIVGGPREYKPVEGARQANKEHFWEWHPERRMTTGAIRLTDYNFKKPNAAMEVDRIGDAAYEQGQTESYDYPGDYLEQGKGKGVVGLRTLQERGQDARHRAVGDCTSLGAGMTLTLTGDQVNGVKGADYLCLSASHSYVSDAYGSGETTSDGHAYSGEYVLMPVTAPLAPEMKTPRAIVQGPQTAVVVGEGEIDCDEYGRILVHFHWDLEKAYSMRCRVSQNWAGNGWGGMVIPRIGMEVVVEFLEGDPDKPLVTGCVYNGKNDVPYPLPEHKTRSTFKTDTHQGSGFNELRFEDENGEEEIYLHAEMDRREVTKNDRSGYVGRDRLELTEGTQTTEVGRGWRAHFGKFVHICVDKMRGPILQDFRNDRKELELKDTEIDLFRRPIAEEGSFTIVSEGRQTLATSSSLTLTGQRSAELMSPNTVQVDADKHLSLNGGKTVNIETKMMNCTASDEMNFSTSGAALTVSGDVATLKVSKLIIRADSIDMLGRSDISIESQGPVKIKGSRIDLN